jgi:hypothetical protein
LLSEAGLTGHEADGGAAVPGQDDLLAGLDAANQVR